jgi:hypothetical protein
MCNYDKLLDYVMDETNCLDKLEAIILKLSVQNEFLNETLEKIANKLDVSCC